jgi:hypothetical protein
MMIFFRWAKHIAARIKEMPRKLKGLTIAELGVGTPLIGRWRARPVEEKPAEFLN